MIKLDVKYSHLICGTQQKHTTLVVPWKVKTYHSDVDYSSRLCLLLLRLVQLHAVLLEQSEPAVNFLTLLQYSTGCLHVLVSHGYSPEGGSSLFGHTYPSSYY